VITVRRWSGREVRALREAKRMSVRAFADHLGVSDRMISKWEAGGEQIIPRPVNQAALDTSLSRSTADVHTRFAEATMGLSSIVLDQESELARLSADRQQIRHPVDGKLMIYVDAGVFLSGGSNEPVWLAAFYIDVYPTSNADYSRFVAASEHPPPSHWPNGKCPDELLDHPVVNVTWHDSVAYADWAGKLLPSSQQWEKAARGTEGKIYPWGDQPTPAKCNVREARIGSTTPVDRYHSGVSPFDVYDMCGNVWEWCNSESTPDRFELKGSAFTSPFARATPSAFNDASADMFDDDTGFRCVVSGEAMKLLLAK
jgi:formylglycine-generating enzyme required for sulfatase activity